ncbi:MAG: hypothetical protein JO092_04275 [Candidatus Eremiobacteraeota bacterium]|nr:hypothetical protein [Candidatus Eremiobacteraeota bacterium]
MHISHNTTNDSDSWPDVNVAAWSGTKRSLHMYAQMLGKIRLALSPTQPNWMFTALYLSARGVTTGFIPWELSSLEARVDVFESRITVARSNGSRKHVALLPVRPVAEVYADVSEALRGLGIECHISPIPQEVPDTTPFDEDRRPSEYDPAAVSRCFRAFTATAAVFERWRAHFFGRSSIAVWWGGFDVALLLFSGKRVTPPTDRGYLVKYDLDAELMSVGLFLGDEQTAPFFYGYIFPEPPGAEQLAIRPPQATWSTQLREWTLPYEAVRSSNDPKAMVATFVDSIYAQCFAVASWNRDALKYDGPKRPGNSN